MVFETRFSEVEELRKLAGDRGVGTREGVYRRQLIEEAQAREDAE